MEYENLKSKNQQAAASSALDDQMHQDMSDIDADPLPDPLVDVLYLVPSTDPTAETALERVLQLGSAKEVIIAAEEVLEKVHRVCIREEDADPYGDEGEDGLVPITVQISRLVRLFTAISRVPIRRKLPSETISSFVPYLAKVIQSQQENFSRDEGRRTILRAVELAEVVMSWVEAKELSKEEVDRCRNIMKSFLETTIESLEPYIQVSVAARAFERCFPRLALVPSRAPEDSWEEGEKVIQSATSAYTRLLTCPSQSPSSSPALTLTSLPPNSTQTHLILYTHALPTSASSPTDPNVNQTLQHFFPIILYSLNPSPHHTSHPMLHSTLALLLLTLSTANKQNHTLPPSLLAPLASLFPPLASAHPDEQVRHWAFRVLELVLGVADEIGRVDVLKELVEGVNSDEGGTGDVTGGKPMRVAAVGLLKDALLNALDRSKETGKAHILAPPRFLQIFARGLFTPEPKDLFTILPKASTSMGISMAGVSEGEREREKENINGKERDKLRKRIEEAAEYELPRISQVLGLYYVLLVRDTKNMTGIQDSSNIRTIERSLLEPMRCALPEWMEVLAEAPNSISGSGAGEHDGHGVSGHAKMCLVSLQLGLERIDGVLNQRRERS